MSPRSLLNASLALAALGFLAYSGWVEFSGNRGEQRRTTISLLATGSREQKAAYESVIASFEKTHPDLRVRLEWGGSGDFFGMLLTRMAGGVPPDITFMYEFKLPYFAKKNTLLDLRPWMERDFGAELADWHPKSMEIFSQGTGVYALPVSMAPVVLFYNRAHFAEAGLEFPNPSWTWEQLREAAIKLTKRDENGRVIRYGLSNSLHFELLEILAGVRRFDGEGRSRANDPRLLEVVQFNADLVLRDRVAPDVAASQEHSVGSLFESGKASMTIVGRWMVPTYNQVPDLDYDVAPLPLWKSNPRVTYTHAVGFSIARESKHKEAAWEFLKFLGSTGAMTQLTELGDTVPARRSLLGSPAFLRQGIRPEHDEVFAQALDYSEFIQVLDPPAPTFYKEGVDALFVLSADAGEVMSEVQRKTERWIEQKQPKLLR